MAGENEGLTEVLPEQFTLVLESNLLRYLGGAIVGGTIGDIIQEVFSGVLVEMIVNMFMLVGMGSLVYNSPGGSSTSSASSSSSPPAASSAASSASCVDCPPPGPTSEVQIVGGLIALLVVLYVLWKVVRPRIQPSLNTRKQQLIFTAGLSTISAGVIAGALFGVTAAVVASSFVGLAIIELNEPDRWNE